MSASCAFIAAAVAALLSVETRYIVAALIALAGAMTLAAALRNVYFGLALLVALCGMTGVAFDAGPVTMLPEHAGLVIVAYHSVRIGRAERLEGRELAVALLLGVWVTVSVAASVASSPVVEQSLRLILWTVVSLAALFLIRRLPLRASKAAPSIVTAGALVSSIGTIGFLGANSFASSNLAVEADYASESFRAKGLMLEPNLLASYALAILCLALIFRRHIRRAVLIPSFLALSSTIVVTYTRAAAVVLLGLCIAMLLRSVRRSPHYAIPGLIAAVIGVVLLARGLEPPGSGSSAILDALTQRASRLLDLSSGTGLSRTSTVELALQDTRAGNWMGEGYNSFPQRHANPFSTDGRLYLSVFPVSLLHDSGIVGLAAFASAYILMWRHVRVSYGRGADVLFFALGWVSLTTNEFWFAFPWVSIGILLALRTPSVDQSREPASRMVSA